MCDGQVLAAGENCLKNIKERNRVAFYSYRKASIGSNREAFHAG
jgi:hypothetical protein